MRARTRLSLAALLACGMVQIASAQFVVPVGASFDLAGGSIDLGCVPLQIAGTYSLSGGTMTDTGALTVQTSGVLNAQGTAEFGSDFSNLGTLNSAQSAITLDGSCAAPGASIQISGNTTVSQLTLTSTSGQQFVFEPSASLAVTGALTIAGVPGQPLTLTTSDGRPVAITTAPGVPVTNTNATLVNVTIGGNGTVTPPNSVTPVPVLGGVLGWGLSLFLFIATFGTFRRGRSAFRKQA